jgi:hypothetical protein
VAGSVAVATGSVHVRDSETVGVDLAESLVLGQSESDRLGSTRTCFEEAEPKGSKTGSDDSAESIVSD